MKTYIAIAIVLVVVAVVYAVNEYYSDNESAIKLFSYDFDL